MNRLALDRVARGALMVLLCATGIVHAETVRVGGTGSAIGTMQRLAQAYQKVDPTFTLEIVPNLGSSGGIKATLAGALQIGVVSRPLKPDEIAAGGRAIEYGRTAFVIATLKRDVTALSLADLADLYAGRRSQWADGEPVRLVLRPQSDADSGLLASFSPQVKIAVDQALARDGMVVAMTDQEAVDAIERLPGGIGTTSLALLLSERRRARPVALDGVAPTVDNVASGRYPFVKTMYVVLRADAVPAARKFAQFILSDAGRQVLLETGHVPAVAPTLARAER